MSILIKNLPGSVRPLVLRNLLFGLVGHAVDFDMPEGGGEARINEAISPDLLAPLARELGCTVVAMNAAPPRLGPILDAPAGNASAGFAAGAPGDAAGVPPGQALGNFPGPPAAAPFPFQDAPGALGGIRPSAAPGGPARPQAGRQFSLPPHVQPGTLTARLFLPPSRADPGAPEEGRWSPEAGPGAVPGHISAMGAVGITGSAGPGPRWTPESPGSGPRAPSFPGIGPSAPRGWESSLSASSGAAPAPLFSPSPPAVGMPIAPPSPVGGLGPGGWRAPGSPVAGPFIPGLAQAGPVLGAPEAGAFRSPGRGSQARVEPAYGQFGPPVECFRFSDRPSASPADFAAGDDSAEAHWRQKREIAEHNAKSLKYYKMKYPGERDVGIIFSAAKSPSEDPELGAELVRVTLLALKVNTNYPVGCIVRPSYVEAYARLLGPVELKTRDGEKINEILVAANNSNRAYLKKFLRLKFVIPLEEIGALFALVDALYYSPHIYYERPGFLFQNKSGPAPRKPV